MTNHLTVRLAWHDNNWDGNICQNPEENVYCVGNHSLLSERIERTRKLKLEQPNSCNKLDSIKGYIPPCYWSCNAFSSEKAKIFHEHPFNKPNSKPLAKNITEDLDKFSIFSWPFKSSFTRTNEEKKTQGKYPKYLEKNLDIFLNKLKPNKTIVFFYLNYDNAVAPEEHKYLLLGASKLTKIGDKTYFDFDEATLRKIRNSNGMQNFPIINWSIQFTHDFEKSGFILPYKRYLDLIATNPKDQDFYESLLKEVRVLISEPSLTPCFKYVAMDLDHDNAIYLLYKLKKSLEIIQKHGIEDCSEGINRVTNLIKESWDMRGLYPSLGKILDVIQENDIPVWEDIIPLLETECGDSLMESIFSKFFEDIDHLEILSKQKESLEELKRILSEEDKDSLNLMKRLSLFSLSKMQINRILNNKDDPFKKEISKKELFENPYLLVEYYKPKFNKEIKDYEEGDSLIDVFKVDIGLFPDRIYTKKRDFSLQGFLPKCPERLRALITSYLKELVDCGDCFSSLEDVYEVVIKNPLFYKVEMNIRQEELIEKDKYVDHFNQKLKIVSNENGTFFYLKEIYEAEQFIRQLLSTLLNKPDIDIDYDIKDYLKSCIKLLSPNPHFDKDTFLDERRKLYGLILKKPLFVLTGNPGSGKTTELKKIVEVLKEKGEEYTILAPTGKATLRINRELKKNKAKTVDMFILENDYYDYLENFENYLDGKEGDKFVENLIIDESSMVDLVKLTTVLCIIDLSKLKRLILIGDENQLPPIGFGKPFYDIIQHLKGSKYKESNYIKLISNCRQKKDETILQIAEIFASENRYYEDLLFNMEKQGQISEGLKVLKWKNKDQLFEQFNTELLELMKKTKGEKINTLSEYEKFNAFLNIKSDGYDPENSCTLDLFQALSPYRGGYFGTLGLNDEIHNKYRKPHFMDESKFKSSPFFHADKVIRIVNWYKWNNTIRRRELALSNGSIGLITNNYIFNRWKKKREWVRRWYFSAENKSFFGIDDDENFELAYAITVHKAQGSDFNNVFLIIPNKHALLSKELIYTALTRSTESITVFLQEAEESILDVARARSFVTPRNTSIFTIPENNKEIYEPAKGIFVKSKIECLIYQTLDIIDGLMFCYEEPLELKNKPYKIKPDFTIIFNGIKYYWEHLGKLDDRKYVKGWQERKKDYEENGFIERVITTDDMEGYSKNTIFKIIEDIKKKSLKSTPDSRFSLHHYQLNESFPNVDLSTRKIEDRSLLKLGESKNLEFKSTLLKNLHTKEKDKNMEMEALKTIVAFLNSQGGKLVIGFNEINNEVLGIEEDFEFVKNKNQDGFGLKLDNLIINSIGKEFADYINVTYEEIKNKTLCIVDVKPSKQDAFLKISGKDPMFFIRMNNSTERLNMIEYKQYKENKEK